MLNLTKTFLPAAVVLQLAALAVGAPMTIAEVAPKDAAFILSVDDFAATKAAFDKTGLRKAWDDKRTQDFVAKFFKKEMDEMAKSLEDSGIKLDELEPPSGPVGAAGWMTWSEKDRKLDPRLISLGDWGDKAEATAKQIETAIAEAERKKDITLKEDEYAGAKLWVIEIVQKPKAEGGAAAGGGAEGEEEIDLEGMDEDGMGGGAQMMRESNTIVYARMGNNLLATSDVETMERTIDRLSGKDSGPTVGDSAEFAGVLKQLDKPQAYVTFLPGPMLTLLGNLTAEAEKNPEGMDPSLTDEPSRATLMTAFGLTGVKGIGAGVRFDTPGGVMEQTYSVLCPDKKGVMSLFSGADQKFSAPAFAGADAAGITLLQFKFTELLNVLTEGARSLPPEIGDEMVQNVQQAQLVAGPILSNLGPQVWMVQSVTKPFSASSSQALFAIACKDVAQINQALQNLGGMLPLQSRDFQGNQVWSLGGGMPLPGIGEMSIGVGFGHVFIGQTALVENAMRSAGNPDAANLNSEPRFTEAVRGVAASGLAFSWADMKQGFEYMDWQFKNPDKMVEAQMAGMFGDDPDAEQYKKEAMEEAKKNQPEWMKEIPLEVLSRELGDTVFEFHVVPEGLRGRSLWLRPRAK
ncbi:MAG: hypothetical protein ACKVZJ_03070 [Phycisphaerales bacterium]